VATAVASGRVGNNYISHAPVAQRIEHLTTDQKVRGSNPFGRTNDGPLRFAAIQQLRPSDAPGLVNSSRMVSFRGMTSAVPLPSAHVAGRNIN
jgi:hypothetical protein